MRPEEVLEKYKSLRKLWFHRDTPSQRRVELLGFVTEFCEGYYDEESGNVGLTWLLGASFRQVMKRWNQRYPQGHEWHYKDVRNFRRDARDTFEALTRYKDF